MNKPYDATAKALFESDPVAWAAFLGIHRPADRLHIVDADLSTITTAADKVLRIDDESPWLLHVEFQSSWDGSLPRRLLAYNAVLAEKHGMPVYTVVVLLAPRAEAAALSGQYEASPGFGPTWEFRYTVIHIWQLPVEAFLNGPMALLPFAVVAAQNRDDVSAMFERVTRRIKSERDAGIGERVFVAIGFLLELRYGAMTAEELMREVPNIREYSVFRTFFDEGKAEGKALTLRDTILHLGVKKFGPIAELQRESLNAIQDLTRLEAIRDNLFDASNWDELLRDASCNAS